MFTATVRFERFGQASMEWAALLPQMVFVRKSERTLRTSHGIMSRLPSAICIGYFLNLGINTGLLLFL